MKYLPNQPALARVNQGARIIPVTVLRTGAVAPGFYTCSDAHGNELNIHRQNLMPAEPVPLRFRRASFERYAHVIGAALRAFPGCVEVETKPMTPESYAQPLRDAIRAKQMHGYRHPEIDEEMFARDAANIKVYIGVGVIYAGGLDRQDAAKMSGRLLDGRPSETDVLVDASALDALCLMLTKRQLTPAPFFTVHGLTAEDAASYESRYDVAFVPHENQAGMWRLVPPFAF